VTKAKRSKKALRERRLHYRLLGRAYDILRSDDWRVRLVRMHGNKKLCGALGVPPTSIGTVDDETQLITVDMRNDILSTVLHECLHVLVGDRFRPGRHKAEEREVLRLEKLMMRHLSHVQATRLFRLVAERLE
jgi:hypothetical protein